AAPDPGARPGPPRVPPRRRALPGRRHAVRGLRARRAAAPRAARAARAARSLARGAAPARPRTGRLAGRAAVPGPDALPAPRRSDQGRVYEHGPLARGARAAPRPPAGGVRRDAAAARPAARRHDEVPVQARAAGAGAGRDARPPQARLRDPPRALVPRTAARLRPRPAPLAARSRA